jgi:hypothetical protein
MPKSKNSPIFSGILAMDRAQLLRGLGTEGNFLIEMIVV